MPAFASRPQRRGLGRRSTSMLSRRMPSLAFYFVWMADVSTAQVDEQAEAVAGRSARLATGAWDAAVAKTEPLTPTSSSPPS